MPVEIEVPTEQLHEQLHHEAAHSQEKWITWVALSTAFLAALAAVTALLAGYHANTAVIDRVKESNKWSYYQSNSVKAALITGKMDLAKLLEKPVAEKDLKKLDKYEGKKKELLIIGNGYNKSAEEHFEKHEWLAYGVTLYQVAIAIAAISAVTKIRPMWYMSLACGAIGTGFLIYAIVALPLTPEPKEEESGSETSAAIVDLRTGLAMNGFMGRGDGVIG